ncbi:hypothetical protein RTBOTA2_003638 [Rhodotorula toruloides]|uniref:Uncharacterized protein n=1 Tax=Rhodotorula toruloides TaxID=5286 RepID=A0A2T0AE61_RHOTO|nr:hypothetical protein RTBOTA2_003638 [Rhodotorula toruloides]PRQ76288.1 hypothetical protein AAT19DRAFT_13310 [Rhodotorula toruloides]
MKHGAASPPTPAMGNSPRRSHSHPLAYLSSRRGIVVLAVALFGIYALFSHTAAPAPSAFVPQTIKDNWGWRAADERWDANQAIEVNRIPPKKEASVREQGGAVGAAEEVKQEKEVTWFVAEDKKANAAPANSHGSSRIDDADDELGLLSSAKEKLRDQAKAAAKQVRPFGKAPPPDSGDAGAKSGTKSSAAVDVSSGSKGQDKAADNDFDDEMAGSASFSPDEMALADAPNMAAMEDAAARAPMAALPAKWSEAKEDSTTSSQGGAVAPAGAKGDSHAAARLQDSDSGSEPPKEAPAAAAATEEKKKPLAAIAGPLSKPKKIGTGGRVVKPEAVEVAQKPAQRVGAGAKAGAVVQEEAGRRVGTGARPGAKGMGTRRRVRRWE